MEGFFWFGGVFLGGGLVLSSGNEDYGLQELRQKKGVSCFQDDRLISCKENHLLF